jgi:hypothetical protein
MAVFHASEHGFLKDGLIPAMRKPFCSAVPLECNNFLHRQDAPSHNVNAVVLGSHKGAAKRNMKPREHLKDGTNLKRKSYVARHKLTSPNYFTIVIILARVKITSGDK